MNRSMWLVVVGVIAALLLFKSLTRASADKVSEFKQRGALVIDVRTESEYREEHLPQAINIPLNVLKTRIQEVAPNLDQPILLHCESGARSEAAVRILKKMGYQNVLNVGSLARARALLATQ